MNLIVHIDLSLSAKNVAKYTAAMAQETNSNVLLLYMITPLATGISKNDFSYKDQIAYEKTKAEIKLEALCKEIRIIHPDMKCSYVVSVARKF